MGEFMEAVEAMTSDADAPRAIPKNVTIVDKRTANVVDSEGRLIKVRPISAVQRMRLYGMAGPDQSQVDRYMGYVALAASVMEIDGALIPFPKTVGEAEAVVGRLDDHGMIAVSEALGALAIGQKDVAAAAKNL
jgi:hypothetical protein